MEGTRQLLLDQHERLRAHIATCVRLVERCDAGGQAVDAVERALDFELEVLRDQLSLHNATEAAVIRRLLHGASRGGGPGMEHLLAAHAAEHAIFWELLSGTRAEVAARIQELAVQLDRHMASEEQTFFGAEGPRGI